MDGGECVTERSGVGKIKAVEAMVRKLSGHFNCLSPAEIHVGASDNPFQLLRAEDEDILKEGRWLCRRAPSPNVAEAAMSRLGQLGMTVRGSDGGWGFLYAFQRSGTGEA